MTVKQAQEAYAEWIEAARLHALWCAPDFRRRCRIAARLYLEVEAGSLVYDLAVAEASRERIRASVAS